MRVLHCFSDQIHSDYCIDVFEDYQNVATQDYVVVCDNNTEFKFIKNNTNKIKRVSANDIIPYINKGHYDALFLHSLSTVPYARLYNIKRPTKIFWFAWGFDIYSHLYYRPFVKLQLYRPLTKKALSEGFINSLRVLHGHIVLWKQRKEIEKSIERIDYFSGVLPEEYDLINTNSFFHAKRVDYSYFQKTSDNSLEKTTYNKDYCGYDILVGNSGDPTNNHIDAYTELSKLSLGDKCIFSFLSYGGTSHYRDRVIEEGRNILGSAFHPINKFLTIEEFKTIIQRCGNVIMYHERQQAMGNIYQAFSSGCKVYLSETSVTYTSLKKKGYIIFSVQHDLTTERLNKPLTTKEIQHNVDLMQKYLSVEMCYKKIDNIFEIIRTE